MSDLNQTGTTDTTVDIGPDADAQDPKNEIGRYTAFDWSPEPHYLTDDVLIPDEFYDTAEDADERDVSPLSEDARNALMNLDSIFSKADVAPRRIEIEQAWRSDHYDRGYQHLLRLNSGGWTMPGAGTYGAASQKRRATLYHTNVYGEKGEIITAALAREVPRVQFFPINPDHPPDTAMAEVAGDLKELWAKNNALQSLERDIAKIFWNHDRCLLWTRYELNGDEYGYEDLDEPVVPETEQNPPTEPLDTEGAEQEEIENRSPQRTSIRKPRGRVVTTALGKLDHKVPIYTNDQSRMGYIQIFEDKDVATVKAQFPWMRDKVKGGGDGTGETEFDRIARENVRQAVPGSYVTGDSMNRHCVVKHTYIRRSQFYDAEVKDEVRQELLDKFPDGALLVKAATEFAFARNENIDDHCEVGHPFPGQGQNRRSLGESLLPIQDYINELIDLSLDFAKRTVPKKWMDSDAFNVESLKSQTNTPGAIGPFQSQPGKTVDQLIFIEPTPTPQPWLITYVQWIVTALSEQISGAMPSLFGAAITGQVGSEGVAIQRDQAMQRVGCPWNAIQTMFASAARQAVMLIARCANSDIHDVIPGRGKISIKLNDMKGAVTCYPESNPEFPESWAQKETRIMSIVDKALASPATDFGKMVLDPKNLKAIKTAIRLPEFEIKGAASVDKQEAEFEVLLRSGPQPNPQKMKLQQLIEQAQQGVQAVGARALGGGAPPSPEEAQQIQTAGPMIQQLQQQMQTMPDMISTVPVRGDGSEDDGVEAAVCFDWMNGSDGRKYANGSPQQKTGFANVLLHWTEHTASAKKQAAANQPPPMPPKVSFSVPTDKMPPNVEAMIVAAGGIPANPADFQAQAQADLQTDVAKKVIPKKLESKPAETESQPPRKLRR